ncbi:MAG: Killer protein [Alphaproteobacteria bacterium]|nr:Killer protein [Alphaproteobacteria bacterium]
MIKSFAHKGLERFFTKGSKAGIQANHAAKLRMQLTALHTAVDIDDMRLPGWRLHGLTGRQKNTWSIWVNGNWRVTFVFENGNAYIVNYEDYH